MAALGRAGAGAAAALAALVLAVLAGLVGTTTWWRAALMVLCAVLAWMLLLAVLPLAGLADTDDAASAMFWPAAILVIGAVWFTVADAEVHGGRWDPVVVQDYRCAASESGCTDEYRVTDAASERDLGWVGCADADLSPGDATRVRADPQARHRPSLEPCAFTSPGWTVALHITEGAYVLFAVVVFGAAVARSRPSCRSRATA
jgi:hypothetical protein